MPRPRRHPTNARFSDRIVLAKRGERVGLGVEIGRASLDYLAGASARGRGSPGTWRAG